MLAFNIRSYVSNGSGMCCLLPRSGRKIPGSQRFLVGPCESTGPSASTLGDFPQLESFKNDAAFPDSVDVSCLSRTWAHLVQGVSVAVLLALTAALGMLPTASPTISSSRPYTSPMPFASVTVSAPRVDLAKEIAVYKLQKVFAMNAVAKLCAIASIALPLIFMTAWMYKIATGTSLKSAMFKTYTILQDTPGADACGEDSVQALLVTNFTHIIGIFTYALLLGVVVDDVSSIVSDVKRGNNAVYETGHTVVLNCNRHTQALLRQWSVAQKESGHAGAPVVVLADMPKEELDVVIDAMREQTGLDIMGREGRPYNIDDLNLVSAGTARTVILMDPSQGPAWDEKMVTPHAATLVSLASVSTGQSAGQTIVLQMPDSDAGADVLQAASRLHSGVHGSSKSSVVNVEGLQALSELQAQCAVQPGLAAFHNTVFSQSATSPEFYVKSFPSLDGQTYQAARRMFKKATIMGVNSQVTGTIINPSDAYVIQAGDELVALTNNADSFIPDMKGTEAVESATPTTEGVSEYLNKRIIVMCFDQPAPQVTQGLESFLPKGANVTYVCMDAVTLPKGSFSSRHVSGSPSSTQTLMDAGIETADSIIITGIDNWEPANADIQVLSTVAHLSDICSTLERTSPLHVVTQSHGGDVSNFTDALYSITTPKAGQSALLTTDVLKNEDLVAGILTQSAMSPHIAPIITDMLDAKGARVMMRSPLQYAVSGEKLTMSALEDRVRSQNDTLAGYYKADGSIVVAAPKSTSVSIDEISHFIIVSDRLKW